MKDIKIKYCKTTSATLKQCCDKKPEFSYLLDEYDVVNNPKLPNVVLCSNKNKFFWICQKCHHKWTSTIRNRLAGHGCPSCRISPQTSFSEKILYYYSELLGNKLPSFLFQPPLLS